MGRCSWKPLGMLWFDVNWCDVRRVHLGKPFLGAALSLEAASSVEAGTPLEIVSLLGAMVSQVLLGLGGICFVAGRRVSFFLISGGVWGNMYGAGGGMRVLGIQLVNISRSLEISVNYLWWLVAGAYLIE